MNRFRVFLAAVCLVSTTLLGSGARPAAANGAASTRNIILGGALAGAGTLIWLNHNKKVHERYAEYDQRQAATQAQASDAQNAYQSELAAYNHEASLVSDYQQTIAFQHSQVLARDQEIAALKHSLVVAKYGPVRSIPAGRTRTANRPDVSVAPVPAPVSSRSTTVASAASYGWGTY